MSIGYTAHLGHLALTRNMNDQNWQLHRVLLEHIPNIGLHYELLVIQLIMGLKLNINNKELNLKISNHYMSMLNLLCNWNF